MNKLKLIITTIMTFALAFIFVTVFYKDDTSVGAEPKTLYQVYLGGEAIGITDSKEALEQYIDNEQQAIKDKYNVKNVYPPKNLHIEKYISYTNKIYSAKEIYSMIKKENPFTIKGYEIVIKKEQPINIYVLNKNIFSNAVTRTIQAFVTKEEFQNFNNSTQPEIKTTGKIIEDLYIQENIVIKDTYISADEQIFTSEDELTKYLLFGTTAEQQQYVVKFGDTIEDIAFNNKLGVEEFMVVNPSLSTSTNLLFPGQVVNIGLINPVFNIVVEEHVIVDQNIAFKTEYIKDPTIVYGKTVVKQEGIDGVERVTQKLKKVNGQIINAVISNSELISASTTKIIARGTMSSGGGVVLPVNTTGWLWPTRSPYIITSVYGYRWGTMHLGVDISGTGYGSPIYASRDGVVYKSAYSGDYGNLVVIDHGDGYYTGYAHMARRNVSAGATVKQGTVIGAMGSTGFSTGTHLHFEAFQGEPFKPGSVRFNPMLLFR